MKANANVKPKVIIPSIWYILSWLKRISSVSSANLFAVAGRFGVWELVSQQLLFAYIFSFAFAFEFTLAFAFAFAFGFALALAFTFAFAFVFALVWAYLTSIKWFFFGFFLDFSKYYKLYIYILYCYIIFIYLYILFLAFMKIKM